jgi:hypothetical protein
MPKKELPERMVVDTLREILLNQLSDAEIAEKCLGGSVHAPTVSGIRRNPPGLIRILKPENSVYHRRNAPVHG